MIYLNAFILCGTISMIGQIILDNTNLTPGHITSIFVIVGAVLSFLGILIGSLWSSLGHLFHLNNKNSFWCEWISICCFST